MKEFSELNPLDLWYAWITTEDFIASLPKSIQKSVRKRIDKIASGSGSELDFPKLAGAVGGQIRIREQPS